MPYAIRLHEYGGTDKLRWEEFDPGDPGPGEVRLKQEAVGLNFIDVYHRTGLYPLSSLPGVPGMEGAGTIQAVGEGVEEFQAGERVAYAGVPGAYAQERLIPWHRLVQLPEDIGFEQAAAMMLQGMTARYLLHGCFAVGQGHVVLVHAAAGGVGSLLTQWARYKGATIIGTAGSTEKIERARKNGCHHPVNYQEEDFVARVKEITEDRGVNVVYDGVGRATFMKSLDCLKPMGTMVSFGQASGKVEPFEPTLLAAKGSLFLTRPSLMDYTKQREDLLAHAGDLFEAVRSGAVRIEAGQSYPLSEAATAHTDLENRRTMGSTVLIP